MKLTASKMSRCALAGTDSGRNIPRSRREWRFSRVGVVRVGISGWVGVARVGVARIGITWTGIGIARGVVGRGGIGNAGGSCKSGKEESRDDFELHISCFLL